MLSLAKYSLCCPRLMALTFCLGKGCQEICSRPQGTSGSAGVGRAEVSYKPATAICLSPRAGHAQAIDLHTGGIPKIIQSHSLIYREGNRCEGGKSCVQGQLESKLPAAQGWNPGLLAPLFSLCFNWWDSPAPRNLGVRKI